MEDKDHLQPQDDSSIPESLPPLTLTETPGTMSPPTHSDSVPMPSQTTWQLASLSNADDELTDKLYRDMQKSELLHSLYPYKLALTPGDLESCVVLENSCFSPELAASRDKITYRLAKSSGLNIGLFTTVNPDDGTRTLPTYATARVTETGSPRKSVLVAHILATLTAHETVQDEDMALPKDWNTATPDTTQGLGHKQGTRTIALHSLSVLPELQGSRVGSTLLRSFIQMVKDSKVVDRVALITFERLVPWYERFGFENLGKSNAQYAGEEWYDMVLDFPEEDDSEEEEDIDMS